MVLFRKKHDFNLLIVCGKYARSYLENAAFENNTLIAFFLNSILNIRAWNMIGIYCLLFLKLSNVRQCVQNQTKEQQKPN